MLTVKQKKHIRDLFMNPSNAAAALGKLGGMSKSKAKIAAAKANGAKGGRPKLKK